VTGSPIQSRQDRSTTQGVQAWVGRSSFGERRQVVLAIPTSYMNDSGVAVGGLAKRIIGVGKQLSAAQWANQRPTKAVTELLALAMEAAADAVQRIVLDGVDTAMLWCHSLPT
jgi:peptidyl-tRNA hydrolase